MSHFDIYNRSLVNRMLIFGAHDVIAMKDIFMYISLETGLILTKCGRWMVYEERMTL